MSSDLSTTDPTAAGVETERDPRLDRYARSTFALLTSFVIHVCLLLALACFVVASNVASLGRVLDADPGIGPGEEIEEIVSLDMNPTSLDQPPPSLETAESSPALSLDLDVQLASSEVGIGNLLSSAVASVGRGGNGNSSGEVFDEKVTKGGAAFFGAYAQGERFVFVIDSSRSMTGERWIYACEELIYSIQSLEPNQLFYVIAFDETPKYMFDVPQTKAKFYKNEPKTIVRLKNWLNGLNLGPATRPAYALRKALGMHPDAIFLLSDGELQDDTLGVLRASNGFSTEKKQVPIHAIHLLSREGFATLQLIARENAGTFTPIKQ